MSLRSDAPPMRRLLLFFLLAIPSPALSQDRRGEVVVSKPEYHGEKADAPIPPHMHIRNEGGSDSAGLCVICSVIINGNFQGVPGLAGGKDSDLWRAAKAAPGGYSPDKLARLLQRIMPGEKYASYVGTGSAADREILEKLSKAGYPIGVTMNTGQLYQYAPIHHMVSLVHYRRGKWAMIVDNNRPGFYSAMPATEFDRRWPDMGIAWAWIWTRLPSRATASKGLATVAIVLAAVVVAAEAEKRRDDREAEPT